MTLYHLTVTIHLLAAMVWLGGLFFLVVAAPVVRRVEPVGLRTQLFQLLGRRLRAVGWVAITILLVTGILNLGFRGVLSADALASAEFWSSPYGRTLTWKLVAVVLILGVSGFHDFVIGPAAGRAEPGSPNAVRLRRQASWLGRVSGLIGIFLIYIAVRLARGG